MLAEHFPLSIEQKDRKSGMQRRIGVMDFTLIHGTDGVPLVVEEDDPFHPLHVLLHGEEEGPSSLAGKAIIAGIFGAPGDPRWEGRIAWKAACRAA